MHIMKAYNYILHQTVTPFKSSIHVGTSDTFY